jgi:hypothetical protein
MECRSTGEFAHRETTDYEHLETFNDEVYMPPLQSMALTYVWLV